MYFNLVEASCLTEITFYKVTVVSLVINTRNIKQINFVLRQPYESTLNDKIKR